MNLNATAKLSCFIYILYFKVEQVEPIELTVTLQEIIQIALNEDMPQGDITTDSLGFPLKTKMGRARLIAKEDLVLSGQDFFSQTLLTLDPDLIIKWLYFDGDLILKGQTVASLSGDLIPLLKGERVALNFLGHFSGIATYTRCFVKEIEGLKTQILDTRKTLPLYRVWEKKSVADGQGHNHRLNLSESVLIKDNHIRLAGGISSAVKEIRSRSDLPIEVECSTRDEVKEAIECHVQVILLDNMSNEMMRESLKLIPHSIRTEASGNMSLSRLKSVAELGVDYISVGAITHSAPCADFSLLLDT